MMTVFADRYKVTKKQTKEYEKEDFKYTMYMKRDYIELLFAVLFLVGNMILYDECKNQKKNVRK